MREAQGVLQALLGGDSKRVKVLLAENPAMANIAIAPPPSEVMVLQCLDLTHYRPDARVLAAAIERDFEVLVTYDKTHLLKIP